MYSIYKHTSPSGKVYIGVTKQRPEMRWQNGLGYRTQEYFYRAIQKYRWNNFSHEIICCTDNYDEACEIEKKMIAKHKSNNKKYGYNIEGGGNLKKEVSAKTREKMRAANTTPEKLRYMAEFNSKRWSDPVEHERMRERFLGENNPMYGKKLSEEHKKKLRAGFEQTTFVGKRGSDNSFYGKHHTEETKKKISERNSGVRNGKARKVRCIETNVEYGCIQDAYRATGVRADCISRVCLGKGRTAGGFHWEYVVEV